MNPFAHIYDYHFRNCEELENDTKRHVHHLVTLLTKHLALVPAGISWKGQSTVLHEYRWGIFPHPILVTKDKNM